MIRISPFSMLGHGVTAEKGPEVDPVLRWKAQCIANSFKLHRHLNIWIIASILDGRIGDLLIKLEAWWSHKEKLWVRWQVEILSSEFDVIVSPNSFVVKSVKILQLGWPEHHNNNFGLSSKTLLVVASLPETLFNTVVTSAKVQELELHVRLLLLEEFSEPVWETFEAPMWAIKLVLSAESWFVNWSSTFSGNHAISDKHDSVLEWSLSSDFSMLVIALVECHSAGQKQRLS